MLRDYRATLEDIAGAAEVIRELCAGVSRDELAADR